MRSRAGRRIWKSTQAGLGAQTKRCGSHDSKTPQSVSLEGMQSLAEEETSLRNPVETLVIYRFAAGKTPAYFLPGTAKKRLRTLRTCGRLPRSANRRQDGSFFGWLLWQTPKDAQPSHS